MRAEELEGELLQLLSKINNEWPALSAKERRKSQLNAQRGLTRRKFDDAMARHANNRQLVILLRKVQKVLFAGEPSEAEYKRRSRISKIYSQLTVQGQLKPGKRGARVTSIVSGGGLNSTGKRR